ncbi:peritrophin-48-like [Anopheles nili]|uniref:peritrophin-48-like n=1 Tax=Anopheles nili TaxID=185578 RepID=UPI00237A87C0|nr:peritrophin-48-like [Anopheles nili]
MIAHAIALFSVAFCLSGSAEASLEALCQGVRFATFPHPTECRQYVVCFQGQANLQQCPAGYVFNPLVLFCVLESQFQCPPVTTPTPAPATSTEAPNSSSSTSGTLECVHRPSWESFFCQDARRTFVANPMNCTQYINCRSDPPSNSRCTDGTVFSDAYQDCLPGDGHLCSLATVSDQFCENRTDGSYAHPSQCNRFVSCVRQQVRLETCPPFFVFDPLVAHCVKGSAVTCSRLLNRQ